jgi:hypothetical protein
MISTTVGRETRRETRRDLPIGNLGTCLLIVMSGPVGGRIASQPRIGLRMVSALAIVTRLRLILDL